jgi:hypothetical protein
VVRHVREHCPEMGIGECTDETVYLKVGQPIRLAYCTDESGENDVIINLPFHNHHQKIVAIIKEFS